MFQAITKFQTDEPNLKNDKKPSFGPDIVPFGLNLGPRIFYGFYLKQMLDITARYH